MFYEKLNNELVKRHMNLTQLSKETNISQPTTSRWKKGGLPGADALVKICKYLNVSADYLLDLDETPPPITLTDQEIKLIKHFRICNADGKDELCQIAQIKAEKQLKQETSLNSKKIG